MFRIFSNMTNDKKKLLKLRETVVPTLFIKVLSLYYRPDRVLQGAVCPSITDWISMKSEAS